MSQNHFKIRYPIIKKLLQAYFFFFLPKAFCNVEGTEFQHFNPSASGLDFVTVHSSKTLSKGIFNLGLFVNYARNGLPEFSGTESNKFKDRKQLRNQLLSSDINIGFGLADRWDLGINIPATNYQDINVDSTRVEFKRQGINDLRLTSKFRLFSKNKNGVAIIGSINFHQIEDNPFAGRDPGPTYNGLIAFDTRVDKVNLGFNAGYRQRNPGSPLEGVPILPFEDQYIASVAVSHLIKTWDVLGIAEVFASEPAGEWPENTEHLGRTREGLMGIKYLWNHHLAFHGGFGRALQSSTSSPDLRLYLGVNWAFKPVKKTSVKPSMSLLAKTPKIKRYTLRNIEFSYDSTRIVPGSLDVLDEILLKTPLSQVRKISVIGHTDSLGSEGYNISLSQMRAQVLSSYVIEKYGIATQKVRAIGRGESEPIATNENFQGRQRNRRVTIEISFK